MYKIIYSAVFGGTLAACGIDVFNKPFETIVLLIMFNIGLFWNSK